MINGVVIENAKGCDARQWLHTYLVKNHNQWPLHDVRNVLVQRWREVEHGETRIGAHLGCNRRIQRRN